MMKRKNRGFTLIELIVVIFIIGALVMLIMPALSRSRERAKLVECMNNTRQLTVAALLYAGDHNGEVPDVAPDPANPDASLANTDYIDNEEVYVCPNDSRSEDEFGDFRTSYTASLFTPGNLFSTGTASRTILYIESDKAGVETRDEIDLSDCAQWHGGITVIAYADGSVTSYNEENVGMLAQVYEEDYLASRGRRLDPGEGKPDYAGTPRLPQDEWLTTDGGEGGDDEEYDEGTDDEQPATTSGGGGAGGPTAVDKTEGDTPTKPVTEGVAATSAFPEETTGETITTQQERDVEGGTANIGSGARDRQ